MSLFIAPKGPGFTTSASKLEKLGYKSIDSAELIFDDYRMPADHLIGGVEGQGFFQATGGLELGRINVAARGVGIAEGALRLATDYAQQSPNLRQADRRAPGDPAQARRDGRPARAPRGC